MVTIGKKGDVTGKQKALKESQSYPTNLGNLWSTQSYQTGTCCSLFAVFVFTVFAVEEAPAGGDLEVSNKAKRAKSGDLEVSNKAKRAKSHTSGWKRPVV